MSLSLSFFLGLSLQAQPGVDFYDGSWDDMLAQARKDELPVFVEVYTDWCQPCEEMQLVYGFEKVGKYINEHFISYRLNAEKGDGPAVIKEFGIQVFPSLLFINGKGELIHLVAGKHSAAALLEVAKVASENEKSLAAMKTRYLEGERSPSFLHDYAMVSHKAGLDVPFVAREFFASQKDSLLISPMGWDMIRVYAGEAESKEFKFLVENRKKFIRRFTDYEVNYKIASVVLNAALANVSPGDPVSAFESNALVQLKSLGLSNEPEFFSRVRILYKKQFNHTGPDYAGFLIEYADQFELPSYEYNFICREILNLNSVTNEQLQKTQGKLAERLKKEDTPELQETAAWFLFRLKKNDDALRMAEKALKELKNRNRNTAGCESLIRLLKKK